MVKRVSVCCCVFRRMLLSTMILGAVGGADAATAKRPSALGMPATAAANWSLGSTDAATGFFTTDYGAAFDAALPPIRPADLDAAFQKAQSSSIGARDTLRIRAAGDIAQVFELPARDPRDSGPFTRIAESVYGMDPFTSVALYARDHRRMAPMRFDVATGVRERIGGEHLDFLDRIGIDRSQIQFLQTVLVSMRSEDLRSPMPDAAPPEVYSIMTYASRVLAGVQVEGSYAKVVSAAPSTIIGLDVSWPAINFHPGLRSGRCKDLATLRRDALSVLQRVAGGSTVNVLMAYVLRPVRLNGERVFIPALKIGILPSNLDAESKEGPELEELMDAYVDLAIDRVAYDPSDLSDDDSRDGAPNEMPIGR